MDLEKELVSSTQKARLYDNSINFLKKNMAKCAITMKEIKSL